MRWVPHPMPRKRLPGKQEVARPAKMDLDTICLHSANWNDAVALHGSLNSVIRNDKDEGKRRTEELTESGRHDLFFFPLSAPLHRSGH
jgi:hypothetical protein